MAVEQFLGRRPVQFAARLQAVEVRRGHLEPLIDGLKGARRLLGDHVSEGISETFPSEQRLLSQRNQSPRDQRAG